MSSPLPFVVRIAAGVVGVGIDAVRRLPSDLPSLGVEVAGTVTRWGFQARQQLDELAQRGDELLSAEPTVSEHPAWATFDDEPDAADPRSAGHSGAAPTPAKTAPAGDSSPAASGADAATSNPAHSDAPRGGAKHGAPESDAALLRLSPSRLGPKLAGLSSSRLTALLRQEEAGRARPAVLTLLQNRIVSRAHGSKPDPGADAQSPTDGSSASPSNTAAPTGTAAPISTPAPTSTGSPTGSASPTASASPTDSASPTSAASGTDAADPTDS
ncbi:hypothetical protein [Nakamurella aerolata]|uniref:Lipid droplet-associated protein n=1 Tax=Nakamurella aerolata TaxID=1656892 RepID=A0A849A853_9ACTN|nr:hypothetical protein [Nakamurella aerolata]NNG35288.1 hypothetical protein [Nakamurella aerolata]